MPSARRERTTSVCSEQIPVFFKTAVLRIPYNTLIFSFPSLQLLTNPPNSKFLPSL